ncbi:hypothetical protein A8U91_02795 [Halomonas elongata]|uniref:Glutaredoxin domain-containing protein n=1 Tax=Halomonas elongata TaxID=2746 RepID=A0A1B8NUX4_HALEL|nr:glutaredoxin [Halomonas elongata]OBX33753.1 hypothetical protein A8U91_02795 [Halomonas elongata]
MRSLIQTLLAPLTWVSRKLGPAPEVHRDAETQAEVDRACEALALYQFWSCPYCVRVRREITRLALTIEIRDTRLDPSIVERCWKAAARRRCPACVSKKAAKRAGCTNQATSLATCVDVSANRAGSLGESCPGLVVFLLV